MTVAKLTLLLFAVLAVTSFNVGNAAPSSTPSSEDNTGDADSNDSAGNNDTIEWYQLADTIHDADDLGDSADPLGGISLKGVTEEEAAKRLEEYRQQVDEALDNAVDKATSSGNGREKRATTYRFRVENVIRRLGYQYDGKNLYLISIVRGNAATAEIQFRKYVNNRVFERVRTIYKNGRYFGRIGYAGAIRVIVRRGLYQGLPSLSFWVPKNYLSQTWIVKKYYYL